MKRLGVLSLVVLVGSGCATPGGGAQARAEAALAAALTASPGTRTVLGQADYDWGLRTPGGEPLELEAFRGRVLFINMWASWCAPCVAEMASIERLRTSLAGSGVEFLLVSPEDPAPVERFMKRYGYDLPVLLEVDRMPAAYDLRALPTTWVVDRAGNVVLKHRGATDWDRDAVRAFLRSLAG
jgi:thiol-disulfide isomerase/thioredoxin